MKKELLLTVGIPYYNAQDTIADAVRSVLAQSFGDWELILLDDGSNDRSTSIVKEIRDSRIRVVVDSVNIGLSDRLNQIANMAKGRYLARMDSDDIMLPERLERQVDFLNKNPNVDVVDSAIYTIDDEFNVLGIRGQEPLDCKPEAIVRNGLLIHPTVMARTEWFRKNPYDASYVRAEDRELWCRVCSTTTFARLSEPLLFYRESPTGNINNYIRTGATVHRILKRYGPPLVGRYRTYYWVFENYLKILAYRLATRLNAQSKLIRKRNSSLSEEVRLHAKSLLNQVRGTVLPGQPSSHDFQESVLP